MQLGEITSVTTSLQERTRQTTIVDVCGAHVDYLSDTAALVSIGVPLTKGSTPTVSGCAVETADGVRLTGQAEIVGRWTDGSARWVVVRALVPQGVPFTDKWKVFLEAEPIATHGPAFTVQRSNESVELINDLMAIRICGKHGSWESNSAGHRLLRVEPLALTDSQGQIHIPEIRGLSVRSNGHVFAEVEVTGEFVRARGLRIIANWKFFAGSGLVSVDVTLHNPRRALHRGGLWDLGDAGSVLFRDFTLTAAILDIGTRSTRIRLAEGQPWQTGEAEVYQDSSGGENWQSLAHINRKGVVPLQFRGYRAQVGEKSLSAWRANPLVHLQAGKTSLHAHVQNFWQQFPKAIETKDGRVMLRLFPHQFGDLHEIQGGEQKTHRLCFDLRFGEASSEASRTLSMESSLSVDEVSTRAFPNDSSSSNASIPSSIPGMPHWENGDPTVLARLAALTDEFLSGPQGLLANRERIDEYGWRNFGDLFADHEQLHYHGAQPLISHYNNQFDVLCGLLLQHSRTQDKRWLGVADSLARHVIDIDIYHTTEDRPAYCGGLFWFTDHYLHAETSSHRTYSKRNKSSDGTPYGGGPSSNHNFTTGLLLYHLMTADPLAREAVLSLTDWVIRMDDGAKTLLGLVDDGPTGLASVTAESSYHGPGRGAGNSLNALLDGWLISGDRKYLDYAETIVRRCIHPQDNIADHGLLNAEQRWSYTVFLVSLHKYLECKSEAGEIDPMYGYAQASLLHYGQWMLENERPYFDRIEELEFPTEAWPAQELRKANALRLAAIHASEPMRTQMFNLGDELAERAWRDLLGFATRTTARAMAVVMIEGLRDAELRRRDVPAKVRPNTPLSKRLPESFIPQRERVRSKLKSPRGILSLIASSVRPRRGRGAAESFVFANGTEGTGGGRLITLFGSPRSGTTWLAKILDSHPSVFYSHEPMSKIQDPRFRALIYDLCEAESISLQHVQEIRSFFRDRPFESARPPFFPKTFRNTPSSVVLATYLTARTLGLGHRMFARLATTRLNSAHDLLIKEVDWAQHLAAIVARLDSTLILLFRHPCAVVASMLRGQNAGFMPSDDRTVWYDDHRQVCQDLGFEEKCVRELPHLEFSALQWAAQTSLYLQVRQRHPRAMTIVYEDLVDSTQKTSESIFDFLNWTMTPQTRRFIELGSLNALERFVSRMSPKHAYFSVDRDSAAAAYAWKRQLDPAMKDRVRRIVDTVPWQEFWPAESFETV